jgi:hypothetical protein
MVMVLAAQSQEGGPWLLILFYLPIMVSKYSLDKYMELRTAYREMAAALSNAIDARDSYTRGHSERVSEYAARLAAALKLPDDQIDTIRYVGLLHDVGKVGIRDAIMKKQGTFTLDEYEEMKNHANIGADMLAGLKFLGMGQDWVRYHHERWDGHGFPKGLAERKSPSRRGSSRVLTLRRMTPTGLTRRRWTLRRPRGARGASGTRLTQGRRGYGQGYRQRKRKAPSPCFYVAAGCYLELAPRR